MICFVLVKLGAVRLPVVTRAVIFVLDKMESLCFQVHYVMETRDFSTHLPPNACPASWCCHKHDINLIFGL